MTLTLAFGIVQRCRVMGVSLAIVEGGGLSVRWPKSSPAPSVLLDALKQHKWSVIRLLEAEELALRCAIRIDTVQAEAGLKRERIVFEDAPRLLEE
jgi:hypothetical protein